MWYRIWLYVYFTWFRPMFKWALRRATGKCELLRICCGNHSKGGRKTRAVEKSLRQSHLGSLQRLATDDDLNIFEAVKYVMTVKNIDPKIYPDFSPTLQSSLKQICGYNALVKEIEALKKEKYSTANPAHEQDLLKLWRLLKPNDKLEKRTCKQWGEIGFQGDDPATDFRGMGVLGLQNLLFFAENYNGVARQVLTHSQHPTLWYSYAVVGINLTSMTYHLLRDGALRDYFYHSITGQPSIYHFHKVYCYIFSEFDRFWFASKPKSVMEFGSIRDKFEKKFLETLKDNQLQAVLQNNYTWT
ncbi:ELMO domain-containing protein 2-like [Diadema setosum]|uniref:ELMO domain-containing protein 2-like n=1 Tax=Diadema setosum TaxID=31175 RepID=UPI003B3BDF35